MRYKISKELLSEVLNKDCQICGITDNNELKYTAYSDQFNERHYINVYELAHKCKEWAWYFEKVKIDVKMQSINSFSVTVNTNQRHAINTSCHGVYEYYYNYGFAYSIESDTEPEAIFKACQWILNNKGKLNERD